MESSSIIDAHMHVWDLTRAQYPWLDNSLAEINHSIDLAQIAPVLRAHHIARTILVQAADNDQDTENMLATAHRYPSTVTGIVAYVPLLDPDGVRDRLANIVPNPLIVGIRNLTHDQPDPDFILAPEVDRSLSFLADAGLPLDYVATLPEHLHAIEQVASRHPTLQIVLDHLATPPIGTDLREPWWTLLARAADHPNVASKISGLYANAGDRWDWTIDSLRPYVNRAVDIFTAQRLMYGGDWPISVLAGGYVRVWQGLSRLFSELNDADRQDILHGTAERIYLERALQRSA